MLDKTKLKMNKKGSTLTNWVFVILGVSLFLIIMQTYVLNPMNATYGNNLSVGLATQAQDNVDNITGVTSSSDDLINDAEVSKLSDGLTILEIGAIGINVYKTLWQFADGSFINTLTKQLDLPDEVGVVIYILILISLIFVIVRIFTRGITP
jgi:hypothetical protein